MNVAGTGESQKMVAIAFGSQIRLWAITDDGSKTDVGIFNLHVRVEYLFFIGSQLVALSTSGKIGVWHAMTQHWQIQDLVPILAYDTAGSFLLLGCNNGSIYYIGECFNYTFFFYLIIFEFFFNFRYAEISIKDERQWFIGDRTL